MQGHVCSSGPAEPHRSLEPSGLGPHGEVPDSPGRGCIHHKRAVHTRDDAYGHGLPQSALKAVIPLLPASAGGRGLGAVCRHQPVVITRLPGACCAPGTAPSS